MPVDLHKHLAAARARVAAWGRRLQPVVARKQEGLTRVAARQTTLLRARSRLAWRNGVRFARVARSQLAVWYGAVLEDRGATFTYTVRHWLAGAATGLGKARANAGQVLVRTAASARDSWVATQLGLAQRVRGALAHTGALLRETSLKAIRARFEERQHSKLAPVDGRYRVEISTASSQYVAFAGAGVFVALLLLPAFAERTVINDLIFMFTMLALAQYWNLLAGYAGLVSIGQQAFVGLGGYLLFALTIHAGIDPLLAILLGGLIAGFLALPTALVVFRLRGAYFAIGTWVMAEVYRLVFAQFRQLGGGTGTSLPPYVTNEVAGIEWVKAMFDVRTSAARDIVTYWAALLLAAATILAVYLVLRSRHGLALAAIRDSEAAAESVGVDSFRTKLQVYVLTAVGSGMVGALIYLQKARISPDAAFSVLDWTAYVIFIVVIGGIGTIEGPIVGVLVFYLLQTNLAHWGTWYLILLGLLAILVMLFAPKGIWGYLSERSSIVVFPLRRRLSENVTQRDLG